MNKFTPKQYAKALYDLTNKVSSGDVKSIVKKFVATLEKNRDLSQANLIIEEFEKFYLSKQGREKIEVTTAKGDVDGLKNKLRGEVVSKEDEKVLGGVKIKVGDKLVDNTLIARVNRLKESLEV